MGYIKEILPKMIRYRLFRLGLVSPGTPLNLTFSVTNLCQSRCRTCSIWKLYENDPDKRKDELSIEEIEKIFKSLGHVYVCNISGGEPFLRQDFPQIIELACRYLTPAIIHIPTNAIAVENVEKNTRDILEIIKKVNPSIQLTVKPSLDHAGEKHILPVRCERRQRFAVISVNRTLQFFRFKLDRVVDQCFGKLCFFEIQFRICFCV